MFKTSMFPSMPTSVHRARQLALRQHAFIAAHRTAAVRGCVACGKVLGYRMPTYIHVAWME